MFCTPTGPLDGPAIRSANRGDSRRRTNVQQLTCNIGLSNSLYYLLFSFVLIDLKPFVF